MQDDVREIAATPDERESGWLIPSIRKAHERSETFGLNESIVPTTTC